MKMYKRLLLTFIDKYNDVQLNILSKEMRMSRMQIMDIIYSLWADKYFYIEDSKYILTASGKEYIFPMWNEWSSAYMDNEKEEFNWDYLYIPNDML